MSVAVKNREIVRIAMGPIKLKLLADDRTFPTCHTHTPDCFGCFGRNYSLRLPRSITTEIISNTNWTKKGTNYGITTRW